MSDEATGKSSRTWLYVVGIVALLPLLYALSIGPVFVLRQRKVMPDAVLIGYIPLEWFVEKTGTDDAFEGYVRMWFRLTGTPEP